jgi:hypothetical protein
LVSQQARELLPCEILHIDAVKSQEFFGRFNSSEQEKSDCQRLVFDLFTKCCQAHEGFVPSWQGDGGHAFFPANRRSGNSISAARDFLAELPSLALQTSTMLGKRSTLESARRRFRVKGHFGLIYFSGTPEIDAGSAQAFDAFIKNERELAPIADELFITDQLLERLSGDVRDQFVNHREARNYGLLFTALHRLKTPAPKSPKLPVADGEMTPGERLFLRSQVDTLSLITSARNLITVGLMQDLAEKNSAELTPESVRDLTIQSVAHYLRADHPYQDFRLVLWRLIRGDDGPDRLRKILSYPDTFPFFQREVDADDLRFQVSRAFSVGSPMITQDVAESRMQAPVSGSRVLRQT